MPLRDHFQPPLRDACPWDGFSSAWVNAIVGRLNQNVLPARYRAIPCVRLTDTFEVQVRGAARRRLVAAVELVSPVSKDRPTHRRDFAIKCATCRPQACAAFPVASRPRPARWGRGPLTSLRA